LLREKKEKYKNWRKKRDAESRTEYVQSRRNAKRIVAKTRNDKMTEKALKIEEMSAQEKMKHIVRIAKVKANNKKDNMGNPCMRGQYGQYRLTLWKYYCEELLHEENP